jgi:hypothetical protein
MSLNVSATKRDNYNYNYKNIISSSSLHSTVKKHNLKQIHHAKSYDDLHILH